MVATRVKNCITQAVYKCEGSSTVFVTHAVHEEEILKITLDKLQIQDISKGLLFCNSPIILERL